MSPEQLQCSRDADLRADIWSIGAIMHRLLTGRPPFIADTMPQVCTLIMSAAPSPLRQLRADAPAELEAVVLRCLEKRPEDRFQSVGELAQALLPFAPERARQWADRAVAILRATSPQNAFPNLPVVRSVAGNGMPSSAMPGLRGDERARTRLVLLAAVVSVALGFTIGLVFWLGGRPPASSAGPTKAVETASVAPAADTSVVPAAPVTGVVGAAADAPATPAASVTAAPVVTVSPGPARPYVPPRKPAPRKAGDDNSEFGGRK
jgi:serine/threonine-protein kinase